MSNKRLKVGIPISTFVLGDGLPGIDKFAYNLVDTLLRRGSVDALVFQEKYRNSGPFDRFEICYFPVLKEILGLRRSHDAAAPLEPGTARGKGGNPVSDFGRLRRDIVKSLTYLSKGVDVIHYPTHMESPLPFTFSRTVLTFHDVVPLVHPETSTPDIVERFHRCVKRLRYVDTIVTPSSFSRQEMIDRLGIDPNRIAVCYNGVDDIFFIGESCDDIVRRYSGGSPYVLFVGTLEPRKNVESLLEAFRDLGRDELKLLLAGKEGWGAESIRKKVRELDLDDRVSFPGYVPEEDLPHLYRGAELFVYPSIYEGFGIPVLEAMAAGVPVITSSTTSLPEVGGDAVIYTAPGEVRELREAMEGLLTNRELRDDLVRRGNERARGFKWEKCAERMMAIYRGESITD